MILKSIRWRLPASYAAIAFLAVLSLGSVMLLVLNDYYARQERDYLLGNALALQPLMESILKAELSNQVIQDQVNGLAFLSQTRIRILDSKGSVMADSGEPDPSQVVAVSGAAAGMIMFSMPVDAPSDVAPGVFIRDSGQAGNVPETIPFEAAVPASGVDTILSISASPYGYAFAPEASGDLTHRSSQIVNVSLKDSLGTLEMSAGPTYGSEIIRSVSLAWVWSGLVAVLFAALIGWLISRQVTGPVLALTAATKRMETGDLSARANLPRGGQAYEFRALALSFNSMAQQVEDTIGTLRAFVADAAHELHTPLTALHTNLELAADETDAAQRNLFLERAQEQSHRLEALVSGLLDLSRIESSGKPPETVLLELNPLMQELGEQFAARAEQAGRSFTLELPVETIRVRADDSQLRRVLTNLLENALKFTSPGGRITLRLAAQDCQAILGVLDTGIGIPPEDLPHLFERFHHGRNASRYPGSGLGLAIVKALVDVQNGSIRAVSEVGTGTSMIVALPLPTQMNRDERK